MHKLHGTVIAALILSLTMCLAAVAAQLELPLMADQHGEARLGCNACHKNGEYGEVDMDTCLKCHGPYERLGKLTAGLRFNPHDSHYENHDCNLCHHGHTENEYFCLACHASVTEADMHLSDGIGCSACHISDDKSEVTSESCLACHGPREALAEQTKRLTGKPHASHHDTLSCLECHSAHEENDVSCGTCH
ncbi:MAG: cytochrome c3 family protein [Firmicutes bacterium]|jgi:nitrate reductase cytochrome c-type subunit|nr:cytochrome c3 family protein [Bacillota bacterium]